MNKTLTPDLSQGIAKLEEELARSRSAEQRFRRLVEAAPDAIVVIDQAGRIVLANAQTEALFGYRAEELLGQAVEILVPEPLRQRHTMHRDKYADAPGLRPMGSGLNLAGRHKDGTEIPSKSA